uniref:Uncharacterized protein n=1 Tax=Vespula pensylvanica TaxID=30213 RepID=A0A834P460_VESPE|nr:hypothetical protein H0235_007158 [Vespula pensylvanica]
MCEEVARYAETCHLQDHMLCEEVALFGVCFSRGNDAQNFSSFQASPRICLGERRNENQATTARNVKEWERFPQRTLLALVTLHGYACYMFRVLENLTFLFLRDNT